MSMSCNKIDSTDHAVPSFGFRGRPGPRFLSTSNGFDTSGFPSATTVWFPELSMEEDCNVLSSSGIDNSPSLEKLSVNIEFIVVSTGAFASICACYLTLCMWLLFICFFLSNLFCAAESEHQGDTKLYVMDFRVDTGESTCAGARTVRYSFI